MSCGSEQSLEKRVKHLEAMVNDQPFWRLIPVGAPSITGRYETIGYMHSCDEVDSDLAKKSHECGHGIDGLSGAVCGTRRNRNSEFDSLIPPEVNLSLTDRARLALEIAKNEARYRQCGEIDTLHILIGLMSVTGSVASHVVHKLGVDAADMRLAAAQSLKKGSVREAYPYVLTPRAKQAIRDAALKAKDFNFGFLSTEVILAGLLCSDDSPAANVLHNLGITLDKVRATIREFYFGKKAEQKVEEKAEESEQKEVRQDAVAKKHTRSIIANIKYALPSAMRVLPESTREAIFTDTLIEFGEVLADSLAIDLNAPPLTGDFAGTTTAEEKQQVLDKLKSLKEETQQSIEANMEKFEAFIRDEVTRYVSSWGIADSVKGLPDMWQLSLYGAAVQQFKEELSKKFDFNSIARVQNSSISTA